ncbi:MAG: NADH-quinone oxidoreductase subunit NuoG [Candidatus Zixiibacteriota bacterium]
MSEIRLAIDGKEITTTAGKTILEAALENGIDIPVFCWHPKLKSIGACRVCLVEVEKWPKLQISCSTPAADGMVVFTNNERVVKARRGVIEFILLNHPLDCPTCDKGGECPLQNITYQYGVDSARTIEERQRFITDSNSTFDDLQIGPEIIRNQNRCIHCYRCTRIVDEICEEDDLGAFNRGHGTEILPPPGREVRNLYSGNIVEYCPVGALTNLDWRYRVRVWLTKQKKTICNLCPDNCNLTMWTFRDKIYRATVRRNDRVDDAFLCDVGRYGYQFVQHPDRLKSPMIKRGGALVECSWDEAYNAIVTKIKSISEKLGPQGIAALIGSEESNEDYYVISKFIRSVIGSNSIDHRLHRKRKLTHTPELRKLGIIGTNLSFDDLEKVDQFLIVGSDLHTENPITALRLLKAKRLNGARIAMINPAPSRLSRSGAEYLHAANSEIEVLTCLARIILQEKLVDPSETGLQDKQIEAFLNETDFCSTDEVSASSGISANDLTTLARQIAIAKRAVFITGSHVALHYQRDMILTALFNLALVSGNVTGDQNSILIQRNGSNSKGCYFFGMRPDRLPFRKGIDEKEIVSSAMPTGVPDRQGADTIDILRQIEESKVELTFVVGADPITNYPDHKHICSTLSKLDFLVVTDLYLTETAKLADVILPKSSHMESSGSFCNWEGRIQTFEQVIKPIAPSKPAWRIFADLAAKIGVDFEYESSQKIFDEFAPMFTDNGDIAFDNFPEEGLRLPSSRSPSRNARLQTIEKKKPVESDIHKFVLLTGNGDHHIGRNRTTRSESLCRFLGGPFIGLSEKTANDLILSEGDLVRVENESGKVIGPVKYIENLRDDCVWIPDNFPEMVANTLMNRELDIDKVSLVKV